MSPRSRTGFRRRGAFSLIELLAVMGLIAVLIGLAVPVVPSLLGLRGTTKALSDITSLIERARNEAMTMQTFVWLAFETAINAEGDYELRAVLLAPLDGSVTTISQAGKVQISAFAHESEVYHWPNLKLVPLSAVPKAKALAPADISSDSLAMQKKQIFRFGNAASQMKQYHVITFTPQGYAMLTANPKITAPYVKSIDLGFVSTRGLIEIPDSPGAGLLVDGFSGQIQILRP